jgi:predicted transcriptional regulator
METKELVLKAIENAAQPVKGGEIAVATGIDKNDVDKAIKKLVAEGKITSPQRCYYSPAK